MKQSLAIIFCLLMLKNAFAFAPMLLSNMAGAGCCDVEISLSCSDSPEDQEPQKGHCADDCHCVCCHTFYTIESIETELNFKETLDHAVFKYNHSYSHRFTHGVWQPPRLV